MYIQNVHHLSIARQQTSGIIAMPPMTATATNVRMMPTTLYMLQNSVEVTVNVYSIFTHFFCIVFH